MAFLVDTDVLVDVSRNIEGAIACIESLGQTWALSVVTSLELIVGAKNQREVELIGRLVETYSTIPMNEAIGNRAYDLLRQYARPAGLRAFRFPDCSYGHGTWLAFRECARADSANTSLLAPGRQPPQRD